MSSDARIKKDIEFVNHYTNSPISILLYLIRTTPFSIYITIVFLFDFLIRIPKIKK